MRYSLRFTHFFWARGFTTCMNYEVPDHCMCILNFSKISIVKANVSYQIYGFQHALMSSNERNAKNCIEFRPLTYISTTFGIILPAYQHISTALNLNVYENFQLKNQCIKLRIQHEPQYVYCAEKYFPLGGTLKLKIRYVYASTQFRDVFKLVNWIWFLHCLRTKRNF